MIEFNATVVTACGNRCVPACFESPIANRSCCFSVVRCDPPPAVLAPGPGLLSVANNVGWATTEIPVEYAVLIDVALDRRPYLAELAGVLLIRCNHSLLGLVVDVAAVAPALPASATAGWRWPRVVLNGSNLLRFELGLLPATVNTDLEVMVSSAATNGRQSVAAIRVVKRRRLMRAPPVPAASKGGVAPVQVDHSRRGLLVGGEPFLGSGWYADGNDARTWAGSAADYAAAMQAQALVGDNQVMPYGLSTRFSPAEQLGFLDACGALGIRVIYPLAPTLARGTVPGRDRSYRELWGDPAWQRWVRGNITLVAGHPALLGYYVCDDCCPWASSVIGNVSQQALLYNLVKQLDPYHAIFGAIQCDVAWMWSDVPSFEPPAPQVPGPVIPLGDQPALQLSLDVPMWENYYGELAGVPPPAPRWSDGSGQEGVIRLGTWFEPITNCFGLWDLKSFDDYPASPSVTRSAIWLSVLVADLPAQLTFALEANAWGSPGAVSDGGWLQTVEAARAGSEIRQLWPSLAPPFGQFLPEPVHRVEVRSAVLLRAGAAPAAAPVRVRAWPELCSHVTNSSGICVHVVAVNLIADSAVACSFALVLDAIEADYGGPSALPADWLPAQASRLFGGGGYNVSLGPTGAFSDVIGAGDTAVYEIGCNGPRPSAWSSVSHTHNSTAGRWLPCANRRVGCVHGFPATDPDGASCPRRRAFRVT